MIFILQLVISVIIPIGMILAGDRLKKKNPEYPTYGKDWFSFHTAAARLSKETWGFSNRLFAIILKATGINVMILAALYTIIVKVVTGRCSWWVTLVIVVFELLEIVIMIVVTNFMIYRTYDDNGKLREKTPKKKKR